MNNISMSADKKSLTCTIETLPPEHRLHLTGGINGNMRYNSTAQPGSAVLDEVHVHVQQDKTAAVGNNYILMFNKVKKVEVLEKDKRRTTDSVALGVAGMTALLVVIAVFATSATLGSMY